MSDLLDRLPYARFLGLTTATEGDALTVTMPFADRLIGNPMLPALHGGSTAALLELTAVAQVAKLYPSLHLPKPINVTVPTRSGRRKRPGITIHRSGTLLPGDVTVRTSIPVTRPA